MIQFLASASNSTPHEIPSGSGLSMALDALPVAVKILDADGLARYFNTEWLRMTGRSLDEELGSHWLEPVHTDDRVRCKQAYETAIELRAPMAVEYRVRRQDGRYRWLLDQVVPRYTADGDFEGLACASLDITDRRAAESMLRDLTRRLVSAQEDERRRIARELHDDVNQRLALLAIEIDEMMLAMPEGDPLRGSLRNLQQRTTEISKEVQSLSHELHSSALEALGLVPAIRTLSRQLSAKGLQVAFSGDVPAGDMSPAAALQLFRITQEALTNVLKHSGVREADVRLSSGDGVIVLQIEDRGEGFDPLAHHEGLGLLSMRERLLPLGGGLEIRSRPGEGTVIEARVPRTGE